MGSQQELSSFIVPFPVIQHRHGNDRYDGNDDAHKWSPIRTRLSSWFAFQGRERRAALSMLVLTILIVARWSFSKPNPFLPQTRKFIIEDGGLRDQAWDELLDQFRNPMKDSTYGYTWLPVMIIDDDIKIIEAHDDTLKENDDYRFPFFTSMIRQALQYGKESREKLLNETNVTLPLLNKSYTAIPLLMYLGDTTTCKDKVFPRFSWCSLRDSPSYCFNFALPSYSFYGNAPDNAPDYQQFHEDKEALYLWSEKKAKAIWRGAASGHNPYGWAAIPRSQLVNFSMHHPELLDAAFTEANEVKSLYPEEWEKLQMFSRFGERIEQNDFQTYRAIVDIDGNSWSDRFGNLLCMNSVVVKVQPANMNYFFDELKPWIHYIPVLSDMSDMAQALTFAVSNDTEATVRSIIHRANEWCRERASKERFAHDIFGMLNSYVRLLGTNQTRWNQWQELFEALQQHLTLNSP